MEMNEYQAAALRTAPVASNYPIIHNAALGLCGESGEIADMVKKSSFQGHDLDREDVAKELGDVMWYVALGAYSIGYSLEDIAQINVKKLTKRYPQGFSVERSRNRSEGDV